MPEPDTVEVLLSDLEEWLAVFSQAQQFHYCTDLAEGYRKLSSRFQQSALTGHLEAQVVKVGAYVQAAKEEADNESVGQPS